MTRAESRLLRRYYAFQLLYNCTFYQSIFFVFYAQALGLDAPAVLALQSYYVGLRAAMEVPAGAIADRFGRRPSLVCAAARSSWLCPEAVERYRS